MKFKSREIKINKILLDPNNYRYLDLPNWKKRQANRFHNRAVQDATLQLLERTRRYNLRDLRQSFLTNGYVPLERIVVIPYQHAKTLYLVVEGNRRIATLKALLRDHKEGAITLSEEQIANFTSVPVAILDPQESDLIAAERVIMGMRHIAGPQEWGAYQQAYLILELVDEEGQQYDDIAGHLGLSRIETRRRYRAIRALRFMQNDEIYSDAAEPQLYTLFHELVSIPSVRHYFTWDQSSATFTDEERARQFFELVAPLESDPPAKLRSHLDVRKLRPIIGNPNAEASLLDPDDTLTDAITLAQPTPDQGIEASLSEEIKRFHKVLTDTQIESLTTLSPEDLGVLEETANLISSRIDQYQRLAV